MSKKRSVTGRSLGFDDADRRRVNQAVRQAESATDAEIVPVVARCSGRYDRAEDVVGLWFAALAMILVWWIYPLPNSETDSWHSPSPVWQLVALIAGALCGFLIGAFIATRVDSIRRLFTPTVQMREEVYSRAREIFFDRRIHHTRSGSGVLLYVSLLERRAAVIADQRVLDQLGQQQIDELCSELTRRLQEANVIDALCDTVQLAGQHLSRVLPRGDDDVNELADALVVFD